MLKSDEYDLNFHLMSATHLQTIQSSPDEAIAVAPYSSYRPIRSS